MRDPGAPQGLRPRARYRTPLRRRDCARRPRPSAGRRAFRARAARACRARTKRRGAAPCARRPPWRTTPRALHARRVAAGSRAPPRLPRAGTRCSARSLRAIRRRGVRGRSTLTKSSGPPLLVVAVKGVAASRSPPSTGVIVSTSKWARRSAALTLLRSMTWQGVPIARFTADPIAQPSARPPTTSSGRCAPTYTRANATSTTAAQQRRRTRRGRYGTAAATTAAAIVAWPDGNP